MYEALNLQISDERSNELIDLAREYYGRFLDEALVVEGNYETALKLQTATLDERKKLIIPIRIANVIAAEKSLSYKEKEFVKNRLSFLIKSPLARDVQ